MAASNPKIRDTEEAYHLVEESKSFIYELEKASKEYEAIVEAFLHPENVSNTGIYDFNGLDSVDEIEDTSLDDLTDYSEYLTEFLEEADNLQNKLHRIEFEDLNEHRVVDENTINLEDFIEEVYSLVDDLKETKERVWNSDIRLKRSDKTSYNLIDRKITKERRENRRKNNETSFEVLNYLFSD